MIMLLADLTAAQGQWLVTGLAVVAFLVGIGVGLKNLFGKPDSPLLVQLEEGFVKKKEFEALKLDVHNQLKDMRSYIHEEMHGIRGEMGSAALQTREGFEGVRELIIAQFKELDQKRSVSVANIYKELGSVRDRVAGAEATVRALDQTQHAQDARIDALRQPRRPG